MRTTQIFYAIQNKTSEKFYCDMGSLGWDHALYHWKEVKTMPPQYSRFETLAEGKKHLASVKRSVKELIKEYEAYTDLAAAEWEALAHIINAKLVLVKVKITTTVKEVS